MEKIFDDEGNSVNMFEGEFNIIFECPEITHDLLRKKEVTPNIKIIEPPTELDFLSGTGIIMYGKPIDKKERFSPRQKYVYYLRHEDIPSDEDSKEIRKLPQNHYLEIDIANRKLKLHGSCIQINKTCTDWIYY